jgi:hypothetical protein
MRTIVNERVWSAGTLAVVTVDAADTLAEVQKLSGDTVQVCSGKRMDSSILEENWTGALGLEIPPTSEGLSGRVTDNSI